MTSPLQKFPRGLLELFRLKTQGDAPNKFADTVQPVISGLPFYASDLLGSFQSSPSVGGINTTNGLTADASPLTDPQILYALGGVLTMGAAPGTFFEWWVQVNFPSLAAPASVIANGHVELSATSANDLMPFGFMLPQPLVVPPGTNYRVGVHGDGTGTDHSLTARYLVANLAAQ